MAKADATKWVTHAATVIVTEGISGKKHAKSTTVRVMPTRIEDVGGRIFDPKSGRQTGPKRLMGYGSTYLYRLDMDSLQPITGDAE